MKFNKGARVAFYSLSPFIDFWFGTTTGVVVGDHLYEVAWDWWPWKTIEPEDWLSAIKEQK